MRAISVSRPHLVGSLGGALALMFLGALFTLASPPAQSSDNFAASLLAPQTAEACGTTAQINQRFDATGYLSNSTGGIKLNRITSATDNVYGYFSNIVSRTWSGSLPCYRYVGWGTNSPGATANYMDWGLFVSKNVSCNYAPGTADWMYAVPAGSSACGNSTHLAASLPVQGVYNYNTAFGDGDFLFLFTMCTSSNYNEVTGGYANPMFADCNASGVPTSNAQNSQQIIFDGTPPSVGAPNPTATTYTTATSGTYGWTASDAISGLQVTYANWHNATLSNGSCINVGGDTGWQNIGNVTSWSPGWGANTCFQYQVLVYDWNGNYTISAWSAWIVSDQIAPDPTTTLSVGASGYNNTGGIASNWNVTDAGSGLNAVAHYRRSRPVVDNACTGTISAWESLFYSTTVFSGSMGQNGLADDTCYQWATDANDRAGNGHWGTNGETGITQWVMVDTTAPTPSFSAPAAGGPAFQSATSFTPTGATTDAGSGVASFNLQRQGSGAGAGACGAFTNDVAAGNNQSGSGPFTDGGLQTGLVSGACYRWVLTATDEAGNTASALTSGSILIDSSAPAAPAVTNNNPAASFTSGNTIFFRPAAAGTITLTSTGTDNQSGIASSSFGALSSSTGWTYTSGTVAGNPANKALTWSGTAVSATLDVTTNNNAGTASATTLTFTADASAPTPGFGAHASGTSFQNSTAISFSWTEDEPGAGLASRSVQRQSVAVATTGACPVAGWADDGAASSSASPRNDSGLSSGFCYRYAVTLTDNVGNVSTTTSGSFMIDVVAPSTPVVTASGTGVFQSGNTIFFASGGSGSIDLSALGSDAISGVASSSFAALTGSPSGWTYTPGSVGTNPALKSLSWAAGAGATTLDVTSFDAAGNASGSTTLTLTPNATSSSVSSATNPSTFGGSVVFTASVSPSAATGTMTVKDGGATLGSCTLASGSCTYTTSALSGGGHAITALYGGDTNYVTSTSGALTQNVNPASQTITFGGLGGKTYGDAPFTVSASASSGLTVSFTSTTTSVCSATGTNGATVTILAVGTCTIRAAQAGNANYGGASDVNQSFTVGTKVLTVSATGVNRAYDATNTATVTLTDNRVSGDVLTSAYTSATFADKNVGVGKTISVSGISISGASAGNYSVNTTASTSANITARPITVTGAANSKTYDATTSAAATPTISAGSLAGSDTATWSETYNNKNVGVAKTLTPTGSVADGNGGANYAVTFVPTTNGTITARPITVTATTNTKTYDHTTSAAALPTITSGSLVGGDSATWSETYASATVGTNKTLNAAGTVSDGNAGANYSVTFVTNTTGVITTANILTVTGITAVNKTYDQLTSATLNTGSATLVGVISGDTVTLSTAGAAGSFADKNVANSKTVTVSGLTIGGADAANYTLTQPTTTANITAKALTVSATGVDKGYDAGTSAIVTLSDNRLSGDVLTTTATVATFANANAGAGKTVSVSGISITGGADAGNYAANTTAATTATITARAITVTAAPNSRTYDATISAAASPTITAGTLAGSDTASWTETYNTKHVGTTKTLTPAGSVADGNAGANYAVTFSASTNGTITARPITVTAAANAKTYDAATSAAATPTITTGSLVGSDTAPWSETYDTKNVGVAKTLTPAGTPSDGNAGANYAVTFVPTTNGTITARAITITATANSKTYDQNTSAAAIPTISVGALAGSDTATWSETYDSKNVGTTKTLTPAGSIADGNGGANYAVTFTTAATGTITARALAVTATGAAKTYDANATAAVTLADNRIAGDVLTLAYISAAFADKNVGVGKTVSATGISISGTDAANYGANTSAATTATITARALTVTATANSKTYDHTTSAAATPTITAGTLAGSETTSWTETYDTKNVGSGKTLTPAGSVADGNSGANYVVTFTSTANGIITTANILTVTGITAADKTYDRTTSATLNTTGATLVGVVSGDTVTLAAGAANGTFADKNVGVAKTVTISGLTISGADAGNYTLTQPTTTATITAKTLTVSATAGSGNKTYDASTTATVTLTDNRIGGDVLTVTATGATFADKNVGVGKTVSVSGISITGADSGNYSANTSAATTATITARAITVTAAANTKVYDADTSAAAIPTITAGALVGSDSVTWSETYNNKNVGSGKTLTPTGTVADGNGGANYVVTFSATTNGTITARPITVTALTNTKTYDATTSAAALPTITSGSLAGSDSATWSETYASATVGTSKTLTPAGSVADGNGGTNYAVTFTTNSTGVITTANILTVTGIVAANKVYDRTTSATLDTSAAALVGVINGDSVTLNTGAALGTFADKNVSNSKTVTVSGLTIGGADAGNYSLTQPTTTANITAKSLIVSATGVAKTYDANTTATVTLTDNRLSGDVLSSAYTGATFANANVGSGKTISVSGISISGTDAGNYSANTTAATSANLTARPITVTAATNSRVYNASVNAVATPTITAGTLAGSDTASWTETYNNKNVGTAKTLTPAGSVADGNAGANYAVTFSASTNGTISTLAITVTAAANTKVYDTNTSAAAIPTITAGALAGSDTTAWSETYDSKNVGGSKTLTPAGSVADGNGGNNYTVTFVPTTTGTITQKSLTVSATGLAKTYDANATASVTLTDNRLAGDVITSAATSATFADANVGVGKSVSVTGISISGADAGNYSANTTASTTANITARPITVTAAANTKVYDHTTNAAAIPTISAGTLAGSDTVSWSETYDNKNVGSGKTLTPAGSVADGNSGANYVVTFTATTNGTITGATALNVTGITAANKVYDRTTSATLNVSSAALVGVVPGDTVTLNTGSAVGTFADKTIGVTKTVTVSGLTLGGADAGNYSLTQPSASATITLAPLTVSGITAGDKVYNQLTGATLATGSAALVGVVGGDTVTLATSSALGTFADKTVGSGKTVTISGLTISGADAANYSLTQPTTTASITAKTLTVSGVSANPKTYDRTTAATLVTGSAALVGKISGDTVTLSTASPAGAFADANVGVAKTVTVSGLSISGADAGNYSLTQPSASADITAKTLTVTGITAADKVYDRLTSAPLTTGSAALVGVVSGDTVILAAGSAAGAFADKNVAVSKTVTVSGLTISGADAANYSLTQPTTSASITARSLTVSATGVNRTYDSTTTVTVTLSDNRIAGDVFTASYSSATFANKNVGVGKTVSVSGISISGADASNYSVNTTASTSAAIAARVITVTAAANSKVYDADTSAAATPTITAGTLAGSETASWSETYDNKNVGTSKTLTPAGSVADGNGGANYAVTFSATTSANITDGTPPVTTATPAGVTGSNGWFTSATVSVTLSASDAETGVASTQFKVDAEAYAPYTGAFDVSGEGIHTVTFRSTDTMGNVESEKTLAVKIDTTAPSSQVNALAPTSTTTAISVPYTPADATSGVAAVKLYVATSDTVATADYALIGTYTASPIAYQAPGDGNYFFYVRALDAAGNEELAPADPDSSTSVVTAAPLAQSNLADWSFADNQTHFSAGVSLVNDANAPSGDGKVALLSDGTATSDPVAVSEGNTIRINGVWRLAGHGAKMEICFTGGECVASANLGLLAGSTVYNVPWISFNVSALVPVGATSAYLRWTVGSSSWTDGLHWYTNNVADTVVDVNAMILISGLPASVDFGTGVPGDTATADYAAHVITNNSGGYTFTVTTSDLVGSSASNLGVVIDKTAITHVVNNTSYPVTSGAAMTIGGRLVHTPEAGDPYGFSSRVVVPFVANGTYGGTLVFSASTL